jgi:hypothetical protein
MKKLVLITLLVASAASFAYQIGGAYASLLSCDYGQYGYQYGNIGTYDVNGQIYKVFFGSSWCAY